MKFGIIGGSGLYDMEGLENVNEEYVATSFGNPSDKYVTGTLDGTDVVFLPRHGKGHRLLPSELNHKANIIGMKMLGVTHIISISAVGSLREDYAPRDVVIVDQYFDRTKRGLDQTFFGNGLVAHIGFGDPVCEELREVAIQASTQAIEVIHANAPVRPKVHPAGTYINMEGPAFSTKAESNVYRSWGLDVIGMTNAAEAKLSREAEICYCTVAMVTDYDCWHPDHDHVTVEMIIENLQANAALAKAIICKVISNRSLLRNECQCSEALKFARITDPSTIPAETLEKLKPIVGKYYG